jgi:tetratricopeptide (TPR) repeat protein
MDMDNISRVRLSKQRSVRVLRAGGLTIVPLLAVALGASAAGQTRLAAVTTTQNPSARDASAYQALQDGRVADSSDLLQAELAANPQDSHAHQLMCRVHYALNQAEQAIKECEQAVASPGSSSAEASDDELWLGRAYGLKARHAGPLAGFSLARRVQSSFARAVELNPDNVAAVKDLGEYDVSAPAIVGGGVDKARALAERTKSRYPGAAHLILARAAVAENNLTEAEAEFKREIAVEKTPEAWMDLAHFYESHDRPDEALAAVKSGLAVDRSHGPAVVDAASILTAAHRAPDLAERCLREYLASRAKSDAAPAFKVHLQLSTLLAARGDSAAADREREAAAALAPGFAFPLRATRGM